MPRLLCLVVEHGPYGSINTAEAVRHAGGALGKGWEVVLALLGNSVYTALPGQSPPAGEWVSLSDALAKVIADGKERVRVLADAAALDVCRIAAEDMIPGVQRAPAGAIARVIAECDRALLF